MISLPIPGLTAQTNLQRKLKPEKWNQYNKISINR